MKELTDYINRINALNNYDLAWRWFGHEPKPLVEIYEKAERHVLCYGDPDFIMTSLKDCLPDWFLKDPDANV